MSGIFEEETSCKKYTWCNKLSTEGQFWRALTAAENSLEQSKIKSWDDLKEEII